MDVYRQAAEVIDKVKMSQGTAKALCLEKHMQKKRQTYAVVCETLRHWELLQDVLHTAQFFDYFPHLLRLPSGLALCTALAYDICVGRGISTRQHEAARAVTESAEYIKAAYARVRGGHVIAPRADRHDDFNDEDTANGAVGSSSNTARDHSQTVPGGFPRYVRINPLNGWSESRILEAMRRIRAPSARGSGEERGSKRRQRSDTDGGCEEGGDDLQPRLSCDADPLLPLVYRFPPRTDLHKHFLVKQGHVMLQDKGSCFPASVLCDAIPVQLSTSASTARRAAPFCPRVLLDGCSAPGNKTLHLAALLNRPSAHSRDDDDSVDGASTITIVAVERDHRRFQLLTSRVAAHTKALQPRTTEPPQGAPPHPPRVKVVCIEGDVFDMSEEERGKIDAILLDPSCSSSGVVSSIDVVAALHHGGGGAPQSTPGGADEAAAGNDAEEHSQPDDIDDSGAVSAARRVASLAALQRRMLGYALTSFPLCKRVVYSTCSVHPEENEAVVASAMRCALRVSRRRQDGSSGGDNGGDDDAGVPQQHDSAPQPPEWSLSKIAPQWSSRGQPLPAELWSAAMMAAVGGNREVDSTEEGGEGAAPDDCSHDEEPHVLAALGGPGWETRCIRCTPAMDQTNGFFVACFDR